MKILFISGFATLVRDREASRKLFADSLGLSFKAESDGYLHTETLDGAKSFGLWALSEAAKSCFGTDAWPSTVPAPQANLELEVDDVESATQELEARGTTMLVKNRKEPWGQTVSRFLSPEGLLVSLTFTPWLR
ncbi:MAG TPA: VOC family protein [Gemmatimonadaceae bacterium]|nr:VOC family protein [Gemmatimonadaceae bacterium]